MKNSIGSALIRLLSGVEGVTQITSRPAILVICDSVGFILRRGTVVLFFNRLVRYIEHC